MRIGLLEDDESLIEVITLWADGSGDRIETYLNGKSFRKALVKEKFDVLILDWYLPDTTGLDELDWLRGEMDSDTPHRALGTKLN